MANSPSHLPDIMLLPPAGHTEQIQSVYECVLRFLTDTSPTRPEDILHSLTDPRRQLGPSVTCTCYIVLVGNMPIGLCTPYGDLAFPRKPCPINQNEPTNILRALRQELGLCNPTNPIIALKILNRFGKLNPHQAMKISVLQVTKTPDRILATARRPRLFHISHSRSHPADLTRFL